MARKRKINKEEIVQAAVELCRTKGVEAIHARTLGEQLHCSTQPIFSHFQTIEEVKQEVLKEANRLYQGYLQAERDNGKYPPYKAFGMGYIRFAKEEKKLFSLLFMRDRSQEGQPEKAEEMPAVLSLLQSGTSFSEETAQKFHLEMWIYVHGIASMMATSYLDLEEDTISALISDAYLGIKERFLQRREEIGNGSHSNQGIDQEV